MVALTPLVMESVGVKRERVCGRVSVYVDLRGVFIWVAVAIDECFPGIAVASVVHDDSLEDG